MDLAPGEAGQVCLVLWGAPMMGDATGPRFMRPEGPFVAIVAKQ